MSSVIGENIRKELERKKLTQKELCDMTKISESAMSKYLSSDRPLRSDLLAKIANALGTSINQLLGIQVDDDTTFDACKTALLARSGSNLTSEEKKILINLILEHK